MSRLPFKNECGIALLSVLMFMVLGFAMVLTLLTMVTQGTRLTGVEQKYAITLDAAKSGSEFLITMIRTDSFSPPAILAAAGPSGSDCLSLKLSSVTANWTNPPCSDNADTSDPAQDPDLTFSLSNYGVSVKVIDTSESDTNYYYTISASARAPNSTERAEVMVLYESEK